MSKFLNVGIIQMPVSISMSDNLEYIKKSVDKMMSGYVTPELIMGVEYGISKFETDTIPGKATAFLSEIAKEYGIYFVPGTMAERSDELPEGAHYNTCPVFGPDGELIARYRKKAPFKPGESSVSCQSDDYCVFNIKEKDIKVGVLICYDHFFPEIPRTLALMGAELLLCPSSDPMEFDHIPDILPRARALENEAFFIWTSDAKTETHPTNSCGSSTIVNPQGHVVYKCDKMPMTYTATLNMDEVRLKREYGRDQHLKCLKEFNVASPFANNVSNAPVYETLGELTKTPAEYREKVKEIGMGVIGKKRML